MFFPSQFLVTPYNFQTLIILLDYLGNPLVVLYERRINHIFYECTHPSILVEIRHEKSKGPFFFGYPISTGYDIFLKGENWETVYGKPTA
jgi:hypothetical protein